MGDAREQKIRDWLSTGENADPSCSNCNEHWLLARLDAERERADKAEALLVRRYTNKHGVAYRECRVCGGVTVAGAALGHWPGCALAASSTDDREAAND